MKLRPPSLGRGRSHGAREQTLLALLAAAAACAPGCAALGYEPGASNVVRGPLPTRVQHPLALTLPNLTPRRVVTQTPGELGLGAELAYSSIFELAAEPGQAVRFDAEVLRASARARYGLAARWDLEVELAGVYGSGGFLDHFIDEFHDLIGAPDQGRDDAPEDAFEAQMRFGGQEVYRWRPNRGQLGDTALVLTFGEESLAAGEWGNAWRVGLDLPTGDEDDGSGSGGVDWIAGWNGEYSSGAFSYFLGGSYGVARESALFRAAGLDLPARAAAFSALEWRWNSRLSCVVQLDLQSPLVTDIDLEEIDRPILDLGLGWVRDLGPASRLWGSFHEDLFVDSGPDFTLMLGWNWKR